MLVIDAVEHDANHLGLDKSTEKEQQPEENAHYTDVVAEGNRQTAANGEQSASALEK